MGLLSRKNDSRASPLPMGATSLVPFVVFIEVSLPLNRFRITPVCPMTSPGTFVTRVMRTLKERLELLGASPCRKSIRLLVLPISMPKPPTSLKRPVTLPSLRQRAVKSAWVWYDGRLRRHLMTV